MLAGISKLNINRSNAICCKGNGYENGEIDCSSGPVFGCKNKMGLFRNREFAWSRKFRMYNLIEREERRIMGTITLQNFSSSILSGYTEYIQNVGVVTLSYGAFNNSEKNKTIINKYLVANANISLSSLSNTIMMTQIVSKGQPLKVSVSVTGTGILVTVQNYYDAKSRGG